MQVKLIALAIAAMAATPAFAQSNVKIYGSVDALFETFSNDKGLGTTMDNKTHKTSRLGFQGSEDLGGGLKAFFQLEERFDLSTSTADGNLRFKDKAWVGLSGGFGEVSFGRVPTATDIIFGGGKAANADTIADWASRKEKADGRYDNGISYTSPKLGPVVINFATALKEGQTSAPTPYGISASATFGPAFIEAGYQKDSVDTAAAPNTVQEVTNTDGDDVDVVGLPDPDAASPTEKNMYKTYLLNGGYTFGKTKVFAAYVRSKGYAENGLDSEKNKKFTRYGVGLSTPVSAAGMLHATLSQAKEKDAANNSKPKFTKLGVAYVHSLSKRTQLIGAMAVEKKDDAYGYKGNLKDTSVGIQAGLRHGF